MSSEPPKRRKRSGRKLSSVAEVASSEEEEEEEGEEMVGKEQGNDENRNNNNKERSSRKKKKKTTTTIPPTPVTPKTAKTAKTATTTTSSSSGGGGGIGSALPTPPPSSSLLIPPPSLSSSLASSSSSSSSSYYYPQQQLHAPPSHSSVRAIRRERNRAISWTQDSLENVFQLEAQREGSTVSATSARRGSIARIMNHNFYSWTKPSDIGPEEDGIQEVKALNWFQKLIRPYYSIASMTVLFNVLLVAFCISGMVAATLVILNQVNDDTFRNEMENSLSLMTRFIKLELLAIQNVDMQTVTSFSIYNTDYQDADEAIHYFYAARLYSSDFITFFYISSPPGVFLGVQREDLTQPWVANAVTLATVPNRLIYRINPACGALDVNCDIILYDCLIENITYVPQSRPWYQEAVSTRRKIWTDTYSFFSSGSLGITTAFAHFDDHGNLQFVAAADITLIFLSQLLQKSILPPMEEIIVSAFLIDKEGRLLATPSGVIQKTAAEGCVATCSDDNCCRIYALDSPDYIIRDASKYLIDPQTGLYSNWTEVPLKPGENTSYHFTDRYGDHLVIVLERFCIGADVPDIDWFLITVLRSSFNHDKNSLVATIATSVLLFLLTVALSLILARYLYKVLGSLGKHLASLARLDSSALNELKNYKSTAVGTVSIRELQQVEGSMLALGSVITSFSRYVPKDVVRLLQRRNREAILGVTNTDLTILFAGIADFNVVTETMEPKDIVNLLALYLQEMSRLIIDSGGLVDKYIGDVLMAFWNAPLPVAHHPLVACRIALLALERVRYLQEDWVHLDYPMITVHIGINSGAVLAGNLGSDDRLSYTCVGDNVNLASRLTSLNKLYQTEIIISESTYSRISTEFICRPLDVVKVKGKSKAVPIYELVRSKDRIREDVSNAVNIFTAAFEYYLQKEWNKAAILFRLFLSIWGEDYSAETHLKDCLAFARTPPPSDWDGTVSFTHK